jgi:hypothetical protein
VSFYGDETFECARCHFEVGRHMVFLDRDGELLIGNNWHLSARKITRNTVEWFVNDRNMDRNIKQKSAALSDVLQEIKRALARAKPAQPKSG